MTDYSLLVNKQRLLPSDYIPPDLIELAVPFDASPSDPKRFMQKKAAKSAAILFQDSKRMGLCFYGISGYRSYKRQKEIYDNSMITQGEEHTKKYIALPGSSEHQTGLALDVSSPYVDFDLVEKFDSTSEGIWLAKHAPLYGFIIRYPKGKEDITGFAYEPWHIRYVSKPLARYLSITELTLDEYHALKKRKSSLCE